MRRNAFVVQVVVPWFMLLGLASIATAQPSTSASSPAPPPSTPASPSVPTPASPSVSTPPPPPAAVRATPPKPPPSGPLARTLSPTAKASYDAARLLFADADYGGALLKFQQAYDEAKDARLLWNMASCEEKVRHYSKASALLTRYLDEAKASLTPQDRVDAFELIRTLATFTAPLVVTSDQDGVDVAIDGEPAGTTPIAAPITVDQGSRHVVGKKAAYEDSIKEVAVNGGVPANVTFAMVKIVHEGRVTITAGAHDAIAIDGVVVGEQRFDGVIPSGGHTLRVTALGMRSYQTELTIADGAVRSLSVTLEAEVKPSSVPWWLVATGGAILVAGASVGGYFLFKQPANGEAPVGTAPPGTVMLSTRRR